MPDTAPVPEPAPQRPHRREPAPEPEPVPQPQPGVLLRPWNADGPALLRRTNTEEMTAHLGGPESEEQLAARHQRYLDDEPGRTRMFAVCLRPEADPRGGHAPSAAPSARPVGTIGYWERPWQGGTVYETGWAVFPEYHRRGLAARAARALVDVLRPHARHAELHAFPSVGHRASNGVCRRAGFRLRGECDIEYPPGSWMRCHDWYLVLR